MATKQIKLIVPHSWTMPEIMNTFSPEENACILSTGSEMIKEARSLVASLSQKEIYNKIREEYKEEIQKLELDLLVQKELAGHLEVSIKGFYEGQVDKMKRQIEDLNKQMHSYMADNEDLVKSAVDKEREKNRILLEEKEKRLTRMTETYEEYLKQTKKSSKHLGDEGEANFYLLSETFRDFVGYKIENKSHQAHKGDFHLFFNEFNVLVDLKNYTGSVQKKELEKIEHDLSINDTMDFAWLISYQSNVSDWNRFPIMYKWIVTDIGVKCIIIVNNLNANNNPTDVLRNLWSITNELHNFINKTKEDVDLTELKKLKERDYNVVQKIKTAQKRLSEMKRTVTSMSQITKDIENDIVDAISLLTNELSKNEFNKLTKIKEWWNETVEFNDNKEDILSSTELWNRFKKENKDFIDDNNILIEDFKNCVKNFVDVDNYVEKSKKGLLEFVGFKWKEVFVEEKMEVEMDIPEEVCEKKKKKVVKQKKI